MGIDPTAPCMLSPVDPNPKLTQTAQYFANYMARTNKYGHTADGSRPGERARKHGRSLHGL